MNTTVSCELHLRLVVSSESSLPVPAGLRYDTADPYAVHATFHTGAEETVEWVFARDLLAEGCIGPRYRRRPCLAVAQPRSGRRLHRPELSGGRGTARGPGAGPGVLPEADGRGRAPGTEHRHFDLDQELSHILAES